MRQEGSEGGKKGRNFGGTERWREGRKKGRSCHNFPE